MMDAKKALTDGVFCPMPWTGLMYNFDGAVKNCIRSARKIGNIKNNSIQEILKGPINLDTQSRMLDGQPGQNCHPCYDLENGKKRFNIISDRIFYLRELKKIPFDTYQLGNHSLSTIDVRWSNLCNFACVYCSPEFSSKFADELNITTSKPTAEQTAAFKSYILDHVDQLKHVYMAGGEPMLMKENLDLLSELKQRNPGINLRINTNLSKVDTKIFDLICEFENVHWTVSVETMDSEFEYIRYGGYWPDFQQNLFRINKLGHKISFNMLYFLLNHHSLFDTIDHFRDQWGFHPNSFVAGALLTPHYLNIRHLPEIVLQSIQKLLQTRIDENPGYLLEDSYKNLLHYIQQPFERNFGDSISQLKILDDRRGLDSRKIFKELYKIYED